MRRWQDDVGVHYRRALLLVFGEVPSVEEGLSLFGLAPSEAAEGSLSLLLYIYTVYTAYLHIYLLYTQ